MGFAFYLAGVATGWFARGTVDSSRGLVVSAIAAAYAAADRVKRWGAIEREYVEDLLAESKARFEQDKIRREEALARAAAEEPSSRSYVQ